MIIKQSNSMKEKGNPFYGKKHTEETRKIMKEKRKNQVISIETRIKKRNSMIGKNKGEKSWNWKGGITPKNKLIRRSLEFKLWRESVFKRDNFTCQKCKQNGGILHPHHILNFAQHEDLRFAIDNGITLCESCHHLFHNNFGQLNNTKEQLEEFINN